MSITLDLWQLLSAISGLLVLLGTATVAFGRVLVTQFEARLDERFRDLERSSAETQKAWAAQLTGLERSAQDGAREWQRVEREIMGMKADLPLHYVRREDYIRNQSIIEAKLDGLALRLENAMLKGGAND